MASKRLLDSHLTMVVEKKEEQVGEDWLQNEWTLREVPVSLLTH